MTHLAVRRIVVISVMYLTIVMMVEIVVRYHAQIGMCQSAVAHNSLPRETRRQKSREQHDQQ